MANIIKKKDNDKKFVFTCPICGTIFTERERSLEKYANLSETPVSETHENDYPFIYISRCPNCDIRSEYLDLEEYDKNKDYD